MLPPADTWAPALRKVGDQRTLSSSASDSTTVSTPGMTVFRAQPLTLHCDNVTMSFPVPEHQLDAMQTALDGVVQTFTAKGEATRPQRWEEMTYSWQGRPGEALEYLEVFCNPNAHASTFDAQVLVTVRASGGVAFVGEQRLTAFLDDVEAAMQ